MQPPQFTLLELTDFFHEECTHFALIFSDGTWQFVLILKRGSLIG